MGRAKWEADHTLEGDLLSRPREGGVGRDYRNEAWEKDPYRIPLRMLHFASRSLPLHVGTMEKVPEASEPFVVALGVPTGPGEIYQETWLGSSFISCNNSRRPLSLVQCNQMGGGRLSSTADREPLFGLPPGLGFASPEVGVERDPQSLFLRALGTGDKVHSWRKEATHGVSALTGRLSPSTI